METRCTNCGKWIEGWQPYACERCMEEEWESIRRFDEQARRQREEWEAGQRKPPQPVMLHNETTGQQEVFFNNERVEEF